MANCTTTCVPAPQAIHQRLLEIRDHVLENLLLPSCGDDYCTLLNNIFLELQLITAALGGSAAPITTTITSNTNTSGTVAADWRTVTFVNQGATTVTVDGATMQPGASVSLGGFGNSATDAIGWSVPAGGDLLIVDAR